MSAIHLLLALVVVAIWGTNFVVIKIGLRDFTPFLFGTLRFVFSAFPWLLFVKRPSVRWRWLIMFGICLGAGQFGLMFLAMRSSISPGLASLVIQMQVFFTIGISVVLFHERVSAFALSGILLAAAGLLVIALNMDASATTIGVILVLSAAFFWACANIIVKKAAADGRHKIEMLGFMVWSSVFAVPPLLLLSIAFDGPATDLQLLENARWVGWSAVFWQVIGNTLFGYAAWNFLLTKYTAAAVTPYALMVPVFGMGASAIFLGETLPPWKLGAALLVMAGLAVLTLSGKFAKLKTSAST